jgi:hypothetical protein
MPVLSPAVRQGTEGFDMMPTLLHMVRGVIVKGFQGSLGSNKEEAGLNGQLKWDKQLEWDNGSCGC